MGRTATPTKPMANSLGSSSMETRVGEPAPADWVCEEFGAILDRRLAELTHLFDEFITPASRHAEINSGR